ncbi:MAG: hypothetical protein ACI959_000614, partial [Limisphaerales bacterium]
PFFSADHKTLKTIIRTDPGIMLMQGAVILDKWSWRDLPDFDEIKKSHFPVRAPRVPATGRNAIFNVGEHIPGLIASGKAHISEFFASDVEGNDATEILLSDTAYWVIIRQVEDVTQDNWTSLLPVLEQMSEAQIPYYVLTGSGQDEIEAMRNASELDFDYYFSDAELMEKIAPSNEILLKMSGGMVLSKWGEGEFSTEL